MIIFNIIVQTFTQPSIVSFYLSIFETSKRKMNWITDSWSITTFIVLLFQNYQPIFIQPIFEVYLFDIFWVTESHKQKSCGDNFLGRNKIISRFFPNLWQYIKHHFEIINMTIINICILVIKLFPKINTYLETKRQLF